MLAAVKSLPLDLPPVVEAVIAAAARESNPAVLDSADTAPGRGRYTIVAFDPAEVACWPPQAGDPFEGMRSRLEKTGCRPPRERGLAAGGVFCGGWIGYFAYEAGRYIERLPATTAADIALPVARFGLYDTAAVYDADTGRWTLFAADLPAYRHTRPPIDARLKRWSKVLTEALAPAVPPPPVLRRYRCNLSRQAYLRMVERAGQYIAAGDIFQVNLARRLTFAVQEPPLITYLRLRRANPGAYAAFLSWPRPGLAGPGDLPDQAAILSASPELFLQLRGRAVLTRPIKGTRPRSSDPVTDAAYQMELAASEKDRSELAMIVDLERNDLGRVCEYGSIHVLFPPDSPARPYELERHPTVHHLVANVTGRLAEGYDAIDLLRACFPGGSITGAPKVRAMEIIDELEPTERGVYTGSIGYFGLDGSMAFNIAIRTMIMSGGSNHVYAGGGIVADSVPQAEYAETTAKVRGLCAALGLRGSPARLAGKPARFALGRAP